MQKPTFIIATYCFLIKKVTFDDADNVVIISKAEREVKLDTYLCLNGNAKECLYSFNRKKNPINITGTCFKITSSTCNTKTYLY